MVTPAKTPRELVRQFPFFAGQDEPVYDELLARCQTRHFARGEALFHEGEASRGLFLVQAGLVKIFKLNEIGREQILAIQKPGDSVAEVPLFDNGPYPASAAAMEDATVLFLSKEAFRELLVRYPGLSQSVIAALARRLRKLVELVEDLSLRQVRQRLARLLLEEAGSRTNFHLAYTNEELAARLGSVRDVISRTFSGLQNDGFLSLKGRDITILDRKGMEMEAG